MISFRIILVIAVTGLIAEITIFDLQDCPKTTPTRPQNDPKTMSKRTQNDPKTIPKRFQNDPENDSKRFQPTGQPASWLAGWPACSQPTSQPKSSAGYFEWNIHQKLKKNDGGMKIDIEMLPGWPAGAEGTLGPQRPLRACGGPSGPGALRAPLDFPTKCIDFLVKWYKLSLHWVIRLLVAFITCGFCRAPHFWFFFSDLAMPGRGGDTMHDFYWHIPVILVNYAVGLTLCIANKTYYSDVIDARFSSGTFFSCLCQTTHFAFPCSLRTLDCG